MKIKLKLLQFRAQLVSGQLPQTRPQIATAISWVLNFVMGMVLSTIPLFGGAAPFGIAIAARAGGGIASLLSAFALYTLAMFVVQLALFAGLGTA